ncbi:hypothetical protein [Wenyingzhuangia sp. IMCC45467]
MEALFDFGITIIKVYLISYLYVKIYSILIEKFKNVKLISLLPKIEKKEDFKNVRILISVALILFSFTYWGNKGYGDEAYIPIGNNKLVEQSNGVQASITPKQYKRGSLYIDKFIITDNMVFGEAVTSPVDRPLPFFVWNFKKEELLFFKTQVEFDYFLSQKGITTFELKSFNSNYIHFWNIRMILMA